MLKESPIIKLQGLISNELFELEQFFIGKVLTIIDASMSDKEQRKCVKDLIKDIFYSKENTKWFYYHIRRIILEFNEKFAKIPMTPIEKEYLETGELKELVNEQRSQRLEEKQYFEEN
jgi:predicted kinase